MNIRTKFSTLAFAVMFASACAPGPDDQTATPASPAPATTPDVAAPATATGDATGHAASATGTVATVDPDAGTVTIDHGPVEALDWPAMVMGFKATPQQLEKLSIGQRVQFGFVMRGKEATITDIAPAQ